MDQVHQHSIDSSTCSNLFYRRLEIVFTKSQSQDDCVLFQAGFSSDAKKKKHPTTRKWIRQEARSLPSSRFRLTNPRRAITSATCRGRRLDSTESCIGLTLPASDTTSPPRRLTRPRDLNAPPEPPPPTHLRAPRRPSPSLVQNRLWPFSLSTRLTLLWS